MRLFLRKPMVTFSVLAVLAAVAVGCKQQASDGKAIQAADASRGEDAEGDGHDHGGWWCAEHGVPEEECSMCSSKAAAAFKSKGDWCEKHQRAESQCFECDPSRAEKFAKLYEAKYGHAPPKPAE